MRSLIAGNWKMNGLTADSARRATAIRDAAGAGLAAELLICPPATQLAAVARILDGSPVALGGQTCHHEVSGAHTGEIAAVMLADLGCRYVIVGHSERRAMGEIDEIVRQKAVAARQAGLIPIVCVGESEEQRAGGQETETIGWQIEGSLPKDFTGIVAYEPVWAIGSGRVATENDVGQMHAFIREELIRQLGEAGQTLPILYGGSVKPENASAILRVAHVGGALVGGASLEPEAFLAIARAAPDA